MSIGTTQNYGLYGCSDQFWLRQPEADGSLIVAVIWVALTFVLRLSEGERRPSVRITCLRQETDHNLSPEVLRGARRHPL